MSRDHLDSWGETRHFVEFFENVPIFMINSGIIFQNFVGPIPVLCQCKTALCLRILLENVTYLSLN